MCPSKAIASKTEHEPAAMPNGFYERIREVLNTAREQTRRTVNFTMVKAYWEIGRSIVEQQGGVERAEYGTALIKELSERLTTDFGKGFTTTNLKNMRSFYLAFPIGQTLSDQLSWSHYCQLIKIKDAKARAFYTHECAKQAWSVRKLSHQISTHFYERLQLGGNDVVIAAERADPEPAYSATGIVRDPYLLDFLGLGEPGDFHESELEQALIDHLQEFLLELGRGFAFVARQQRISIDGDDFYIDLVFYNYLARCFVLVDLKTGKLAHQDLGQMQMYVNYYTRTLMVEGDEPPIGIVLCADKNDAVVRYTLPEGENRVRASRYRLHIPDESELQREILAGYQALSKATQ